MSDAYVPVRGADLTTYRIDNLGVTSDAGAVSRQRVDVAASRERTLLDYDTRTDGNPVYVGTGHQSYAVADAKWLVYKLFYDSSSRLVDKQVAESIAWTGRASHTWKSSGGD